MTEVETSKSWYEMCEEEDKPEPPTVVAPAPDSKADTGPEQEQTPQAPTDAPSKQRHKRGGRHERGGNKRAQAREPEQAIREISLDVRMIYEALVASGTINVTELPPDRWHSGDRIHTAMYYAHYENPRGIKPVRARKCWRATTSCVYARIITLVYELTNHTLTQEKINAIDVDQFCATYHFTQLISGAHDRIWCNTYSLYVFACAHIESYCHACSPMCPAIGYAQKQDEDEINKFIAHHMQTYDHAKLRVETHTMIGAGHGCMHPSHMQHMGDMLGVGYARAQPTPHNSPVQHDDCASSRVRVQHGRDRAYRVSYYSREPSHEFTLVSNDVGIIEPIGE